MKTKSKTTKPSQRRPATKIARSAADKKKKMAKDDARKTVAEIMSEPEQKQEVQQNTLQTNDSPVLTKLIVNEDEQKKVVNNPVKDETEITGEEN